MDFLTITKHTVLMKKVQEMLPIVLTTVIAAATDTVVLCGATLKRVFVLRK